MVTELISFREWNSVLRGAEMSPYEKGVFEAEIISFLHFCKGRKARVTIELMRLYLQEIGAQEASASRRALLWFVKHAPKAANGDAVGAANAGAGIDAAGQGVNVTQADLAGAPSLPQNKTGSDETASAVPLHGKDAGQAASVVPPRDEVGSKKVRRSEPPAPACNDLGGTDWERRLIAACRERGFQWRTEETYRMWAHRFAEFISPRSPEVAEAREVTAFLSMLAVEKRLSPSSQRQALNALVFFIQEGLGRALGDLPYRRAAAKERIPVVLSREECRRLFEKMTGTTRLMTELAYGSGLRLMAA